MRRVVFRFITVRIVAKICVMVNWCEKDIKWVSCELHNANRWRVCFVENMICVLTEFMQCLEIELNSSMVEVCFMAHMWYLFLEIYIPMDSCSFVA